MFVSFEAFAFMYPTSPPVSFPPETWPVALESEIELVTGELFDKPVIIEPFKVEKLPMLVVLTVVALVDPTNPPVFVTPLTKPEELEFEMETDTAELFTEPVLTELLTVT